MDKGNLLKTIYIFSKTYWLPKIIENNPSPETTDFLNKQLLIHKEEKILQHWIKAAEILFQLLHLRQAAQNTINQLEENN